MSGRNLDGELDAALADAGTPVLPAGLVARIVAEVPRLPQDQTPEPVQKRSAVPVRPARDRANGGLRFNLAAAAAGVAVLTGIALILAERVEPVATRAPTGVSPVTSVIAATEPATPISILPVETSMRQAEAAKPANQPLLADAATPKQLPAKVHTKPATEPVITRQPKALATKEPVRGDRANTPEEAQDLVKGPIDDTRSMQMIGPVLPQRGMGYVGSAVGGSQATGSADATGSGPGPAGPPSRGPSY